MSIKIIFDQYLQGKPVGIDDLDCNLLQPIKCFHSSYREVQNHTKYLNIIQNWDFDAFLYDNDELLSIALTCFKEIGVLERLGISYSDITTLLAVVREFYIPNSYHNYKHAVDVLQSVFYILSNSSFTHSFSDLEIFSLLLAAYCHDIRHPGCSNQFLSTSGSQLAKEYNNLSILEQYHWNQLKQLLRGASDIIMLPTLSKSTLEEIITFLYEFIIATDLAYHFSFVQKLSSLITQENLALAFESQSVRILVACCLLKFSDISNISRPFPIYTKWVNTLMQENSLQYDVETILEFSAHQYEKSDIATFQTYFMDTIAMPFFVELSKLLKGNMFKVFNIYASNRFYWNSKINT